MKFFRKRSTRKPVKKMRRAALRRRAAAKRNAKFGNVRIVRRCTENNLYNTAVAGTYAASGAVVTFGTAYNNPFAGSSYYNIPFSMDVALNDIINPTELINIADKYKINWVKLKVYATSNTASAGGTSQLPSMLWCEDQDDSVVPTGSTAGLNAIREKMGSKYRQFKQNGSGLSIFIKPRMSRALYNTGGTLAGAEVVGPRFVSTQYADIPHFCIKGFLQDVNLAATPTAYTQFKFDVVMSVTLRDIE